MNFRFLLPAYIFAITAVLFSWWYLVPEQTNLICIALVLSYTLAAWWLTPDRNDWWRFAVTPLFLAFATIAFALLISGTWPVLLLLGAIVILETMYWGYAYRYASRSVAYRPFSLERLSASLDFLSVFFLASAAYGLKIFLDLPLWLTGGSFCLLVCVLVLQWIWMGKATVAKYWRSSLVIAVVVIELFFLVTFFPLDYRLLGFLAASAYYVLMSIMTAANAGTLSKRHLRLAAMIIIVCWLAIFATGRWL